MEKAIMIGLGSGLILITPLFFFPTDIGLLVGCGLGYVVFLLVFNRYKVEMTLPYFVACFMFIGAAQTKIHSQLWVYKLTEQVGMIIIIGAMLFFSLAFVMIVYAMMVGRRH